MGDKTVTTSTTWYREPLVWLVIAIPASAIFAGVVTIILAIRSNDGLVVDDYYRHGLEINRRLDQDLRAQEYGLDAKIDVDSERESVSVLLSAKQAFNYPDKLLLRFSHSTRPGHDRNVLVLRGGNNYYSGRLPRLIPGRWDMQLRGVDWRLSESVWITVSNELSIN